MIRVATASDLHIDLDDSPSTSLGGDWSCAKGVDAVLLAGDVHVGPVETFAAVERIQKKTGAPVFFIAGNHEHYGHEIGTSVDQLMTMAAFYGKGKIKFLENAASTFSVRGIEVQVLGTTLWTDYEFTGNPQAVKAEAEACMADVRRIRFSEGRNGRFTADDAQQRHLISRLWLNDQLRQPFTGIRIVMTHHAPTRRAIAPRFAGSTINGGFVSNLEWMIEEHQPDLWCWGHTHHSVNLTIGMTRCVSSQRGYPGELSGTFEPMIVELG